MVERDANRINLETKFLVLEKADKKFGIFQTRVASYPVQVRVKTNLDQAKLKWLPIKRWPWRKMQWQTLVSFHYNTKEMELTAKTEVGNITSKIHLNPKKSNKGS